MPYVAFGESPFIAHTAGLILIYMSYYVPRQYVSLLLESEIHRLAGVSALIFLHPCAPSFFPAISFLHLSERSASFTWMLLNSLTAAD